MGEGEGINLVNLWQGMTYKLTNHIDISFKLHSGIEKRSKVNNEKSSETLVVEEIYAKYSDDG